jgi:hypothetical protein
VSSSKVTEKSSSSGTANLPLLRLVKTTPVLRYRCRLGLPSMVLKPKTGSNGMLVRTKTRMVMILNETSFAWQLRNSPGTTCTVNNSGRVQTTKGVRTFLVVSREREIQLQKREREPQIKIKLRTTKRSFTMMTTTTRCDSYDWDLIL